MAGLEGPLKPRCPIPTTTAAGPASVLVCVLACVLASVLVCALAIGPARAEDSANAARAAKPALPRVVVLATGGTIAGTGASSTTTAGYEPAKLPVEALLAAVPELRQVAQVRGEQLFQVASENMTTAQWLVLARRVNELLRTPDVDGIVVTHGTDTLEETAYFLHLTVRSDKPVVLVGAMRPATALSADGPMNLYNAVVVAGSPEARGRGAMVAFNDRIEGAREVAKTSTAALDTFRAPDLGPLGYVAGGRVRFYRASTRRFTAASEFDVGRLDELPRVVIVYGRADDGGAPVDAAVAAGAIGIVHAGPGNGSVPLSVRPALAEARRKGVVVVRSSRTGSGIVARNGEVDDDAFDFVAGDNLSPQKARILLMLALTRTNDTARIQRFFVEY